MGYLLPLTGIFTKNGVSEQNGFKLGLKHFGTSVDGHPIQVTYANDQGDPTVSLSMMTSSPSWLNAIVAGLISWLTKM